MNNVLMNIFDSINSGLVLLNDNMEITGWNGFMQSLTHKQKDYAVGKKIEKVIPNFGRKYYSRMLSLVLSKGQHILLSSALHKNFLDCKNELNITISRISDNNKFYVLIEFVDVTSQNMRINQLKSYTEKLSQLNRDLKIQQKAINHMAYHDNLTDLANRALFYATAEKLICICNRENQVIGIMFIDVNNFKKINDTYGHEAGDQVLIQVAEILNDSIRNNDMAARFGGDEFLLLLNNIRSIRNYEIITSRIMNSKKRFVNYNGQCICISLSIGVSFYPTDGKSVDELIRKADKAMYSAKRSRNNVRCYQEI